jgi:vacuolar-type H+-ATPase subunit E/Vma4
MPGADLSTELRHRAEETAESILSAARAEADQIASDTERHIEERRKAVLSNKEEEYRSNARARIAAERDAAMRAVLLAKTGLVDRVLHGAKALLPEEARRTASGRPLRGELGEALAFVGAEDDATVRCSEELLSAICEAVGGRRGVTVESDSALGPGFMVVGAGGSVVVDRTLQTVLDRLAPTLAIEIHKRLEGL